MHLNLFNFIIVLDFVKALDFIIWHHLCFWKLWTISFWNIVSFSFSLSCFWGHRIPVCYIINCISFISLTFLWCLNFLSLSMIALHIYLSIFQLCLVFIATRRLLILVASLVVEHIVFKDVLLYLKCYNHPLPSHQPFLQGKYRWPGNFA